MKAYKKKQGKVFTGTKLVTLVICVFFCVSSYSPAIGLFTKNVVNDSISSQILNMDEESFSEGLLSDNFQATFRDFDDVFFNSSFEMGNLVNVTYQDGNASGYRYYTANLNYSNVSFYECFWWFHFSMENVSGKTVKLELQNLAPRDFDVGGGLPRWQSVEPVFSYDYVNWSRVPLENISWNSSVYNFSITFAPAQDKVWFAPIPPYTVGMRDSLFGSFAAPPLALPLRRRILTIPFGDKSLLWRGLRAKRARNGFVS